MIDMEKKKKWIGWALMPFAIVGTGLFVLAYFMLLYQIPHSEVIAFLSAIFWVFEIIIIFAWFTFREEKGKKQSLSSHSAMVSLGAS